MRAWAALVGLIFAPSAGACEGKPFNADHHIAGAAFVGTGVVTGERLPDYERRVLASGDPNVLEMWERRLVRIALLERLAGDASRAPLEVRVPCGAPFPELIEKVVYGVNRDGEPWVFAADYAEAKARSALAGDH